MEELKWYERWHVLFGIGSMILTGVAYWQGIPFPFYTRDTAMFTYTLGIPDLPREVWFVILAAIAIFHRTIWDGLRRTYKAEMPVYQLVSKVLAVYIGYLGAVLLSRGLFNGFEWREVIYGCFWQLIAYFIIHIVHDYRVFMEERAERIEAKKKANSD